MAYVGAEVGALVLNLRTGTAALSQSPQGCSSLCGWQEWGAERSRCVVHYRNKRFTF